MSKIIDFPKTQTFHNIDQAFFEKFADAALLLKCFECVKDATEFVEDGGAIEVRDDVYVSLIEAYWALKVMFERKTGADAQKISDEHWEIARKCLLAGEEPPDMHIPISESLAQPVPPENFIQLTDLELACTAFNCSDRFRLGALATLAADNARITATMNVEAINATTALRLLVLRLSGGSMETMAAHIGRKPGETLQ